MLPRIDRIAATEQDSARMSELFSLAGALFVEAAKKLPEDQQAGLRALLADGMPVEVRLRINPAPVHIECVLEAADGTEGVMFHLAAESGPPAPN